MFIQPDWLDPTTPGVGTNRYAYAGNDPVNLSDPGGNCPSCFGAVIGAAIGLATQIGLDVYNGQRSSLGTYAGAVLGGAFAGATFGAGATAVGSGTAATVGLGTVTGAGGGVLATGTEALIDGSPVSGKDFGLSAGLGGVFGGFGAGVGKAIGGFIGKLDFPTKGRIGEKLSVFNQALRGRVATKNKTRTEIPGVTTPTGRRGSFVPDLNVRGIFSPDSLFPYQIEAKWSTNPKRTITQMSTKRQNQARRAGLLKDNQYEVWSGVDIDRGAVSAADGFGAGVSPGAENR